MGAQHPLESARRRRNPTWTERLFCTKQPTHSSGCAISQAARGVPIIEFGLRRAQGADAAEWGARAAVIAGAIGTSNVEAGILHDLHLFGTQAHFFLSSLIGYYTGTQLSAPDADLVGFPVGTVITPTIAERLAMMRWAEQNPRDIVLLTDTIHSLRSGIPNAIWVFQRAMERGWTIRGIRLDSGVMQRIVPEARAMLDAAGLTRDRCPIMVTDSLDEERIKEYIGVDNLPIDVMGIGTALITAGKTASSGMVYKLAAVENQLGHLTPVMKLSDDEGKAGIVGDLQPVRIYDLFRRAPTLPEANAEQLPFRLDLIPSRG